MVPLRVCSLLPSLQPGRAQSNPFKPRWLRARAGAHQAMAASTRFGKPPMPAVQQVFRTQAAVPVTITPEEMRAFIATGRERWGVLVRDLNIRLE